MSPSPFISSLIQLALAAGREIMSIYAEPFTARQKADLSPVTAADELAERIILSGLAEIDPATPVVAEEAASAGRVPAVASRFYLVDPLDGTKEFISRNGEFTVNIALVADGMPQAGVVFAPALRRLFWGEAGIGAAQGQFEAVAPPVWSPMHVRTPPPKGQIVVASRSHCDVETQQFLRGLPGASIVSAGSSLKFCLVACGEADLYPRFGRTMEWDTAAGHAILAAAGGKVLMLDGRPLTYGKLDRGFDNPGFIASA